VPKSNFHLTLKEHISFAKCEITTTFILLRQLQAKEIKILDPEALGKEL
jgi:hypothetical protein